MNQTYLGLKKFMNQDQKFVLAPLSYKDRRRRLADIAKGMMVQGKALDNFLQQKFADCIRLSIHEHPMIGKKYSLFLFHERQFKTLGTVLCCLMPAAANSLLIVKKIT